MKFFNWPNPKVKWVISGFLVLLIIAAIMDVAEGGEFRTGLGGASANSYDPRDIDQLVAEISYVTWNEHLDLTAGYVGEQFGVIDPYGYFSATGVFYFGQKQKDFRPVIGLGLAARTNGGRELLPLPVNFSLQAGIEYKQVAFMFRHFSNAGIKEPNRGQNLFIFQTKFK